ncbi:hypothetical protein AB4Y96_16830 [Phyllobacterium sp. TAF24]|uniref:hypothetical protein n=1 Tax=Phyllobacterium sp. TAF24 TaxID=3233068 RepID=UPI003F96AD56
MISDDPDLRFWPVRGTLTNVQYTSSAYHHVSGVMGVIDAPIPNQIEKSEVLLASCELDDLIDVIDANGKRLDYCSHLQIHFYRASGRLGFPHGKDDRQSRNIHEFIVSASRIWKEPLRDKVKSYTANVFLPDDLFDQILNSPTPDETIKADFQLDRLQSSVKNGAIAEQSLPKLFITQGENVTFICHGIAVTRSLARTLQSEITKPKRRWWRKYIGVVCIGIVSAAIQYTSTSTALFVASVIILIWLTEIDDKLWSVSSKESSPT